jgi:23S rRNA (uracil1939-C5)-methyltransferase
MINENTEDTNVVLGRKYRTLCGKGGIEDELCGLKFFISPDSFYQVNRDGAEMLYSKARELADLRGGEILMDLYCGTGTIGLSMAKGAKRLVGIEIVQSAVECARDNAERNGIENARFVCADAGNKEVILEAAGGTRPDVVIIDPPRKGSTRELVDCLADLGVPRVVYISCNPDTLARDCTYFKNKNYVMGDVYPFDLFPRTGHVESVVCLERREL